MDRVSTSGRIRLTLEIDWPASFNYKATAADIQTTVLRECRNSLENALREAHVSYRIIGDVEPIMVIHSVKKEGK